MTTPDAGRPPRTSPTGGARTVAGRWLLLDQVGAGGTATVWRALDLATGQEVAAKVLGHHTGALLARFWREQEIRLRHPHLVTATGWAAEEDVVLMVTDLVRGGTVEDLLAERGPLPEGVVATVLAQTLAALAVVHAAGLVHRDVKPANLLLEATDDGGLHVRLADFGLAVDTRAPRLTLNGAVGTVGYVPPDVDHAPDPRVDLYAVGALGVHLLTGRPPHPDVGLPASRLRGLLATLLAPEAGQRPASAEQALVLLRRLDLACEPGPWVRDRLGPRPAAGTTGRRRPRAASARTGPARARSVRTRSARTRNAPAWIARAAAVAGCLAVTGWCTGSSAALVMGLDLPRPFLDSGP